MVPTSRDSSKRFIRDEKPESPWHFTRSRSRSRSYQAKIRQLGVPKTWKLHYKNGINICLLLVSKHIAVRKPVKSKMFKRETDS